MTRQEQINDKGEGSNLLPRSNMWILLYSLIIFTTIAIIPLSGIGDIFWIPKEAMFNLGGFSLVAFSFFNKGKNIVAFGNRWLGLVFLYTTISFVWFFYIPLIFNNPQGKVLWNLWNIRPTINLILGLLLIKALVEHTDNLRRWLSAARFLCFIAFGISVYSILQYFGVDPIFNKNVQWIYHSAIKDKSTHLITFFGHPTLTANFIAAVSPLCLMFKGFKFKIMYSLMLVSALLCNSALSLLAFMAGLLAYLLLMKRYRTFLFSVLFIGALGILAFLNYGSFFSFSGRLLMWKEILILSKDTLIFGRGLGSFAMNDFVFLSKRILSAHSEPLQILYDGGLVVAVLAFGYICDLYRRVIRAEKTMLMIGYVCAFSSFMIICLGNFPLRIAPLALVGMICISALEAQTIRG